MTIEAWVQRLACCAAVSALPAHAQGQSGAGPTVLTRFEIGESYYDEPPADVGVGDAWLGLYLEEGVSHLVEANVSFSPEPDGGSTIYRLTTEPPGAHLLFSGVAALSPGPAVTVRAWPESVWADGETVELPLGDIVYRLRLEAADPTLCDAVVWLESGGSSQRLYGPEMSVFGCDEPHFSVDWAGDLDRDGRLDLVASFSSEYSHHPRVLLLSSAAGPDELVAPAAGLDRMAG